MLVHPPATCHIFRGGRAAGRGGTFPLPCCVLCHFIPIPECYQEGGITHRLNIFGTILLIMNRHMLFWQQLFPLSSCLHVQDARNCPRMSVTFVQGGENGGETAAPTATPNWVQEATPIRTPEPVVTTPPVAPEPELPVYTEIYSNKVYLLYDVIALNYDLKVPAMMIDLEIDPDMVADTNEKYSDYGSKKLITVKKSYPDHVPTSSSPSLTAPRATSSKSMTLSSSTRSMKSRQSRSDTPASTRLSWRGGTMWMWASRSPSPRQMS